MDTVKFDGRRLRLAINSRFGSISQLISKSNGLIGPSKRSALFRAVDGKPVDGLLANTIASVLSVDLEDLTPGPSRVRLTLEFHFFNATIDLLQRHKQNHPEPSAQDGCLAKLIRERLDIPEDVLPIVLDELVRVGHLKTLRDGRYIWSSPSIDELGVLLRRQITVQWAIMRDAFEARLDRRRKIAIALKEIVTNAESHLYLMRPLEFFSADDQVHECFCLSEGDITLIRITRNTFWNVAYKIISDIDQVAGDDLDLAMKSMKAIGGPMLEDYRDWATRLTLTEVGSLDTIRRSFRRHVLRMLEHAFYYRSRESYGKGISKPGSVFMC